MKTEPRTIEQIDKEIEQLKQEYSAAEGTPTEVYTRIVGYYRSVTNWNKGKREEYRHRLLFSEPADMIAAAAPVSPESPGRGRGSLDQDKLNGNAALSAVSYMFFYRNTCPNCPPVKEFVETMQLEGSMINVDTDEGMTEASHYEILAAPTVLFFDKKGKEVMRACNVEQLREAFADAPVFV